MLGKHVEKEKEKGGFEEKSTLEVNAFRFELIETSRSLYFCTLWCKRIEGGMERESVWFLMKWRAECLLLEMRITNANRNVPSVSRESRYR